MVRRKGVVKKSKGGRTPARQFAERFLKEEAEQSVQIGTRVAEISKQPGHPISFRGDDMVPAPSAIKNNALRYGQATNLRDESRAVDQRFRKHGSGLPGLSLSINKLNEGTNRYDHKTRRKFQGRGREGIQKRSKKVSEV